MKTVSAVSNLMLPSSSPSPMAPSPFFPTIPEHCFTIISLYLHSTAWLPLFFFFFQYFSLEDTKSYTSAGLWSVISGYTAILISFSVVFALSLPVVLWFQSTVSFAQSINDWNVLSGPKSSLTLGCKDSLINIHNVTTQAAQNPPLILS